MPSTVPGCPWPVCLWGHGHQSPLSGKCQGLVCFLFFAKFPKSWDCELNAGTSQSPGAGSHKSRCYSCTRSSRFASAGSPTEGSTSHTQRNREYKVQLILGSQETCCADVAWGDRGARVSPCESAPRDTGQCPDVWAVLTGNAPGIGGGGRGSR